MWRPPNRHTIPGRHDMNWHGMRRCEMSCHVMSCHVMSCHVMSCHVMSSHDLAEHDVIWFDMIWHGILILLDCAFPVMCSHSILLQTPFWDRVLLYHAVSLYLAHNVSFYLSLSVSLPLLPLNSLCSSVYFLLLFSHCSLPVTGIWEGRSVD